MIPFIYIYSLIFQGKFIRINFDASGFIAGANIGKEGFFFDMKKKQYSKHIFYKVNS